MKTMAKNPPLFVLVFFCVALLALNASAAPLLQSKTPLKNQLPANKAQTDPKNSAAGQSPASYREREILVKFKEGTDEKLIQELNNKFGTNVLAKHEKRHMRRMRTPENVSMEETLAAYRANEHVAYAEPNYTVTALLVPDDTYYEFQWHLDNTEKTGLNCEDAWDIETGKPDVIVALIDTGVAYEDYGLYKKASDLSTTSFVQGYDFVNHDEHPNDDNGHGTHVAGTIAQSTNNAFGVSGIAFNASIMPIKVLDSQGSGSHEDVANGIYFAVDGGAKVINLSLGSNEASHTLQEAIAYAYDNGVTVVAAAGNDGEKSVFYPAAYDDYVIAVGATRYDASRTYYSNYGSSLDVMAPGGDLSVDQNGDGYPDGILQQTFSGRASNFAYWFYEGTSMATPQVSGVAALLLSHYEYVPGQVREAIEMSARDAGPTGWDEEHGWGIVDAHAALQYTVGERHEVRIAALSVEESALIGDTVTIEATVQNTGNFDEIVTVSVIETTSNELVKTEEIALAAGDAAKLSADWATGGLAAGNYTFSISVSTVENESNTENNTTTFTMALLEPKHDIAITAFDVPLTAGQGATLTLPVTIENCGTYDESVMVAISDVTASEQLAEQSFSLARGEKRTISVSWNTALAALGEHTLLASVAVFSAEERTDDNSVSQTIVITEPIAEHEAVDVEISTILTNSYRDGYSIRAYIRNNEESSQQITLSCTVEKAGGTIIRDPGLAKKQGTIAAHVRGYVTWYGQTRLSGGSYTATVRLAEAGVQKSVTFQVR